MSGPRHATLAAGRWETFTLAQQLGNVGSEVSRALRWRGKDQKLFDGAMERALELLDLSIRDPRWKHRLKELTRARELLCDAWLGGREYSSDLEGLNRYFFNFALAARS
ncbi:MAG: hypothetical protein NTY77_14890 [Elusimicrobia bacterium]|nr:hypothetical protein [Elusimicrobiota bacterium]